MLHGRVGPELPNFSYEEHAPSDDWTDQLPPGHWRGGPGQHCQDGRQAGARAEAGDGPRGPDAGDGGQTAQQAFTLFTITKMSSTIL